MGRIDDVAQWLSNAIDILCSSTLTLYRPIKEDEGRLPKLDNEKRRAVYSDAVERKHPLEETILDTFSHYLGSTDMPGVTVHHGGPVQEFLKGAGALALASDNDIYIKEEVYNPGSTLTDMILLHELTHVLQYQRKDRLNTKEEIALAEDEAEKAERLIFPDSAPCYYAEINGKLFYVNKQIKRQAIAYAIDLLQQAVNEAAAREDLRLLCAIQRKLDRSYA